MYKTDILTKINNEIIWKNPLKFWQFFGVKIGVNLGQILAIFWAIFSQILGVNLGRFCGIFDVKNLLKINEIFAENYRLFAIKILRKFAKNAVRVQYFWDFEHWFCRINIQQQTFWQIYTARNNRKKICNKKNMIILSQKYWPIYCCNV